MKSREPIIDQREKTTRDLFISFGMPKDFVLQKSNRVVPGTIVLGTYGAEWREVVSPKQRKTFEKLLYIEDELK
jgi:hypothetical protein